LVKTVFTAYLRTIQRIIQEEKTLYFGEKFCPHVSPLCINGILLLYFKDRELKIVIVIDLVEAQKR
jgi:hypothetical protein